MGRSTAAANRWHAGEVRQKSKWMIKRHLLAIVLTVLLLLIAVFIGWASIANSLRSPDAFYLLPRNAGDWSGWGTGMGALGTSGALIYAAVKFRSDAEEQRNLRLDRDAEARADATPLDVDISPSYPTEDCRDVSGVTLTLTNQGKRSFSNVQVKIPDVSARITSGRSAPIPQFMREDSPWFGRNPAVWSAMDPPPHQVDEGRQLWLCGEVSPGSMISFYVEFKEIQPVECWELTPNDDAHKRERKGRIALIFDDYQGRTWIRSTEGRKPLQRLWPDSFIVELEQAQLDRCR